MKSTDELKSEIYIHTQPGRNNRGRRVDEMRKRSGKKTAGIIISRAREEMKLLIDLFKISPLFIWQIETRLWCRLFLVRHCVKEYFTVRLFEKDFHPRECRVST